MSNNIISKSFLLSLAFVLTLSNLLSFQAHASETTKNQEEAVKILEALDQSSVYSEKQQTVLINEDKLKSELGNNENYQEIKNELEKQDLLTTEQGQNLQDNTSLRSASNINPKWEEARDKCALSYLGNELGINSLEEIYNLLLAGNFLAAVKKLGTQGFKYTVPGLIALYTGMNATCIKEANSKHNIYQ